VHSMEYGDCGVIVVTVMLIVIPEGEVMGFCLEDCAGAGCGKLGVQWDPPPKSTNGLTTVS